MTILIDGRPSGYEFDGSTKYTNSATSKSLLLKQEIADGDRPDAYSIVDDPLDELGHQVWRMQCNYPRDYLAGTDKARCELQPSPVNDGYGTVGETRWYLATFMLPAEFKFTACRATGLQDCLILFELHDYPNPPRIQPWSTLLAGQSIELWRATVESGSPADYYTRRLRIAKARPSTWYQVAVKAVWDGDTNAGEMDIWFNRRRILSESAQNNVFSGASDMYPKNGMYVSHGWPADWAESQFAYWGGFVVADGEAASFDEFMEECGYEWREVERVMLPRAVCGG